MVGGAEEDDSDFGDEMRLGLQEKRLRLSFCHITTFLPTSTDPCFLSNRRFSLASCGIFIHFPAHSDALFSDSKSQSLLRGKAPTSKGRRGVSFRQEDGTVFPVQFRWNEVLGCSNTIFTPEK